MVIPRRSIPLKNIPTQLSQTLVCPKDLKDRNIRKLYKQSNQLLETLLMISRVWCLKFSKTELRALRYHKNKLTTNRLRILPLCHYLTFLLYRRAGKKPEIYEYLAKHRKKLLQPPNQTIKKEQSHV